MSDNQKEQKNVNIENNKQSCHLGFFQKLQQKHQDYNEDTPQITLITNSISNIDKQQSSNSFHNKNSTSEKEQITHIQSDSNTNTNGLIDYDDQIQESGRQNQNNNNFTQYYQKNQQNNQNLQTEESQTGFFQQENTLFTQESNRVMLIDFDKLDDQIQNNQQQENTYNKLCVKKLQNQTQKSNTSDSDEEEEESEINCIQKNSDFEISNNDIQISKQSSENKELDSKQIQHKQLIKQTIQTYQLTKINESKGPEDQQIEYFERRESFNHQNLHNRQIQQERKKKVIKNILKDKQSRNYQDLKQRNQQENALLFDIIKKKIVYHPDHMDKFDKVQRKSLNDLKRNVQNAFFIYKSIYVLQIFVKKLFLFTQPKNIKFLKQQHIKMIGDLAFSNIQNTQKISKSKYNSKQQMLSNAQSLFRTVRGKEVSHRCLKFLEKFETVLPISKKKIIWDILVIFALIVTLWIYPIDLILGENNDMRSLYGWKWDLLNICVFVIYVCDILLKFITAYYEKAICITDKKSIVTNYLQSWFSYDLFSLLPFAIEVYEINFFFKFWNLLVFLKLPTFYRIMNNVNDIVLTKQFLMNVVLLLRLLIYVTFVAHLFSLLWLALAYGLVNQVSNTWIIDRELQDEYWFNQYIWSFYFTITTMTTVGYGDIGPTNEYETVTLIFGLIVATGIFAFTFNSIGQILEDLQRQNKEFKKQASLVNLYLKKKNSPILLQLQVSKYLEYRYQSEKELSVEEERLVLQKLPENMHEEIKFQQAMHMIQTNHSLFGQFSHIVQERLAQKVKERYYNKHENIFEQNERSSDPCLYFIQSGKVEMYAHSYKGEQQFTILNTLENQQSFGDYSFITGMSRSIGAQTLKATVLCYLKRSDLLSILQKSLVDQEIFCMMRDKILSDSKALYMSQRCYLCNQFGHYSYLCHEMHAKTDIEQTILKQKFLQWQKRDYLFIRNEIICYNSLLDNKLAKERQEDFLYDWKNNNIRSNFIQYKSEKITPFLSHKNLLQPKIQIDSQNQISSNQSLDKQNKRNTNKNKLSKLSSVVREKNESQTGSQGLNSDQKLSKQSIISEESDEDDYFDENSEQAKKFNQVQQIYQKQKENNLSESQKQIQKQEEEELKIKTQKMEGMLPKGKKMGKFLSKKNNNLGNIRRPSAQPLSSLMVISENSNIMDKEHYLQDILSSQRGEKRLIFRDREKEEENDIILKEQVEDICNSKDEDDKKILARRYSRNISLKFQNNMKQKQQDIIDLNRKLELDRQNQYNTLQNDCEIKIFDCYYPHHNYNPEAMNIKYHWAQENLAKTPGIGIYTFYERNIKLNNHQNFSVFENNILGSNNISTKQKLAFIPRASSKKVKRVQLYFQLRKLNKENDKKIEKSPVSLQHFNNIQPV